MAQITPFPADAEEPELEALSREELLALAQELREKLAELDKHRLGDVVDLITNIEMHDAGEWCAFK